MLLILIFIDNVNIGTDTIIFQAHYHINMVQNRKTPSNIPCHSQRAKRAVKLTSESSKKTVSLSKRNKLILAKLNSRPDRKCFKTKRDNILFYLLSIKSC